MKKLILVALLSLTSGSLFLGAQNGPVKCWEGTIDLPTYITYAPEKAPLFARDFAYQRAKRAVYPYPMNDYVSDIKVDSTHRALYLENDYIKVCVLPDYGGRIFYATDKTDNYEIFYRQHVIKPRNIGMLGAWLSGGVEWNVFHHHRNTSQFPCDWKLVSNDDGSKTIWVGEVENRHRMAWTIGMTLYLDKSYIEITGRFFNISQDRNSMLHWANTAVHGNEDYQIIYPESIDCITFHHKLAHVHFPVGNEPFRGNEGYIGCDMSWWKNIPNLMGESMFIDNLNDDFVGGYDHGKRAGTIFAADHNINKGGKMWAWGPHAYGHGWDSVTLTDTDGPYIELMVAAYSDNQPDYCWINPGETKEYHAYWYGCRDLDNVNRANRFAVLNMDIDPSGKVHLAANTTQIRRNARIEVKHGDKLLYSKTALIAPDRPFEDNFVADPSDVADKTAVTMSIYADSELLLDYTPRIKDLNSPLPEDVVEVNPDPKSLKSNDECYFIGMRNLQFHQAHVNPNDYFLEVLSRDPNDVRCNTQMGIFYRRAGDYEKAKAYLRTGIKRQTAYYTRPADGEAMYNLGLILKEEGNWKDAIDTLYRAAWDYEYASVAYRELAQISSLTGNSEKAIEEARMAVAYNGMNIEAKNLLITLLRKAGKKAEALALAKEVQKFNELNYYANAELVEMGAESKAEFRKILRAQPESYLDLAVDYFRNGFAAEGEAALLESESLKPYPTVEYYLGYLADIKGDKAAAAKWFAKAESLPTDYVFPFRIETARPLGKAIEYMPESAVTLYYLGNLWFQKQPDLAYSYWAKAAEIKPDYGMVLRNIGWYFKYEKEDLPTAYEWYKKAIAACPQETIFLTECDEILERMNAPLNLRYEVFKGKEDLYNAYNDYFTQSRAVKQKILAGDLEDAYNVLTTQFFGRREWTDDLHDYYVDACELLTLKAWKEGNNEEALKYALAGNEYPANHEYLHLEYYARDAQVYYLIGLAYEKLGDKDSAHEWYEKAANVEIKDRVGIFHNTYVNDMAYNYEKCLALKKLGHKGEIRKLLKATVKAGKNAYTEYVNNFFHSHDRGPYECDINAGAYYTEAIGYYGLGRKGAARKFFKKSFNERNDYAWVNYYLGNYDF